MSGRLREQGGAAVDLVILTKEQVAERLQVSPGCVYEMTRSRSRNPLPHIKVGKYLRFSWGAVSKWLERNSFGHGGQA